MEKVSVAKAGIFVEEKTYRWEISNFDIINATPLLEQQQIIFEFMDLNGVKSKWKFWFRYASTDGSESEEDEGDRELVQLCFALLKKDGYCSETNAAIDVTGEDAVGKEIFEVFSRNDTKRVNKQRFWTIAEDLADSDLIDGTLILSITLKVFTNLNPVFKEVEMPVSHDVKIKKGKQKKAFYRKIEKLENDKINSDVTIISSDAKEFFAYRWILSDVSDVFEAMFRSDMKESGAGVVKLDDLTGTAVKFLLHFIYTGKVEPQWSLPGNVDELVYAADKYQIENLKNYLDSNIGKICTVENAGNLLILARKFSMEKATANILLFIREKCNNAEDIIDIINNTKNQ